MCICRDLILNKTKIVVAHASSAYKHSLREVLESPGIAAQIKVNALCPSRGAVLYIWQTIATSGRFART